VKGEPLKPAALDAVVKQIAERNKWTGDLAKITCDPNPQLTDKSDLSNQVNETDYQYLQRLAARYGARAFVEYNDGKSRFYFVSNKSLLKAKALGRLEYCRGLNKLIEFKYSSVASRSAKQYVASAVDPVSGEVKTAQGDAASAPPVASTATAAPATPATPTPAPGQPSDPGRAQRAVVTDPTQVLGLRGEGRAVGNIALRAKGKVEIVGLADWAEGDWYVSKAIHTWSDTRTTDDVKAKRKRSSYETKFTATR
jgi:phage protein D